MKYLPGLVLAVIVFSLGAQAQEDFWQKYWDKNRLPEMRKLYYWISDEKGGSKNVTDVDWEYDRRAELDKQTLDFVELIDSKNGFLKDPYLEDYLY